MPGADLAIDSLEAIQAGDPVDPVRGTSASNPVLLLIQQGPRPADDQRNAPLRAPPRAGNRPSPSSTGTSAAAAARRKLPAATVTSPTAGPRRARRTIGL